MLTKTDLIYAKTAIKVIDLAILLLFTKFRKCLSSFQLKDRNSFHGHCFSEKIHKSSLHGSLNRRYLKKPHSLKKLLIQLLAICLVLDLISFSGISPSLMRYWNATYETDFAAVSCLCNNSAPIWIANDEKAYKLFFCPCSVKSYFFSSFISLWG